MNLLMRNESEGDRLQGAYICTVCKTRIRQMVRVGHLLIADPCTHAVLDLRTQSWFTRQIKERQQ